MHKTIPLSKIKPNLFRHMERYPVREQKIQMLMGSMDRTGFWDNVVGRERNGGVELAYGHHRWIAFEKKFGPKSRMNIIIRNLSDEDMLRVMADENADEYGHSAEVEQETIRAVVQAYADGKIELGKPKTGERFGKGLRDAPSFCTIKRGADFKSDKICKPYNAESIAKFLGWMSGKQVSPRVRDALKALEVAEEGLVDTKDFKELSRNQATAIAVGAIGVKASYDRAAKVSGSPEHTEKMKKKGRAVAKQAAKKVAGKLRAVQDKPRSQKGYGVREVATDMKRLRAAETGPKSIPTVIKFVATLSTNLDKILGKKDPRWDKLNEIVKHRENIEERTKKNLTVSLGSLIDRCQAMIDAIQGERPKLKP